MKSAYLLIVAGKEIRISSLFFKVMVGCSEADQKDFTFLRDLAAHMNYYLQLYSAKEAEYIEKIASSLSVPIVELHVERINVHSLVIFIKKHKTIPNSTNVTAHAQRLREYLSPMRYFKRKISVIRKAEAETRNKPKVQINRV